MDRRVVAQMLRDFRVMAVACNAAVPDWIEAIERLIADRPAPPAPMLGFPHLRSQVAMVTLPAWTQPALPEMEQPALPAPSIDAASPFVQDTPGTEVPDDSEDVILGALEPLAAPATFVSHGSSRTMVDFRMTTETVAAAAPEGAAARPLPDNAAALSEKYFQKGESYRHKSDFKRARACYSEAIRLNPKAVPALLERGQIYRLARKPDLAIIDFNAALEVDPGQADGYVRRGNALVDQGRLDEAIEDYGAAIQLDPRNAPAFLNRALAFAKKQDSANVLDDANQVLALNPDLAAAYLLRGVAHSNRNRHELAIADLNRAVAIEPRNSLAYNERGVAFARQGNYSQAVMNYTRALGWPRCWPLPVSTGRWPTA